MFKLALLVGFGGFFGCVLRFLTHAYFIKSFPSIFPYGTFIVNVVGCFIIGILYSLAEERTILSNEGKLLLATGFCGGFTTFSAFCVENLNMIKNDQFGMLLVYISLSIAAGLLFTYIGSIAGKLL